MIPTIKEHCTKLLKMHAQDEDEDPELHLLQGSDVNTSVDHLLKLIRNQL